MEQKRLVFIDCMRGLCILMVVYHHFLVMGMRGFDYVSKVGGVMGLFFVPLFFFVSGFVLWRKGLSWNFKDSLKFIEKKSRSVLLPTIVMFSVCMLTFHLDFREWIFVSFKSGYWFTWVLFQFFFVWMLFNVVVEFLGLSKKIDIALLLLFICGGVGNLVCDYFHESNRVIGFLSTNLALKYFVYFCFGLIVRCKSVFFEKVLSNRILNFVLFLLAVLPIFIRISTKVEMIVVLAQILCIFKFFICKQSFFDGNGLASSFLANCGRNSLAIYFLHYFMLFKLPLISSWLMHYQMDYCFRGPSCGALLEIIVLSILSAVVASCCIVIKKIIDVFPIVSMLCFGVRK